MAYFEITEPVSITDILDNETNVAEILDPKDLEAIGQCVKAGFEADERTRNGWVQQQDEMLKLALQVYEKKNIPWPNAANIKYPLLTLAAIRFQATAYPALVDSINPVKFLVKGEDHDGRKARRAIRLGYHMSYQLIEEMDWEPDMDKALLVVAIIGCAFKKTYRDDSLNVNKSELVMPKDLVADYWTKNLETSRRYTHVMDVDTNYIYEQVASGIFCDVDLTEASATKAIERANKMNAHASGEAIASEQAYVKPPRVLLEQYTYFDLDGDGYEEPYIVSVDFDSAKVFRIVPRFDKDSVFYSAKDKSKLLRIEAEQYFTKIPFIPNPDGSFYDIGFGVLLGSLNRASNTILNQLIDAGTLSNRQSGFLAKGIRIKGGDTRFKPGEWKTVETIANDLKNGIVPLPVREPSSVLYNLLQFLIEAGNRVGSTVDMMVGENPGQNQPATTTMAVLEQGLKVFIAIHKRQFKALKEEYQKLYKLNQKYADRDDYVTFIDPNSEYAAEAREDYDGPANDVRPNADTSVITEAQRISKAQALLQLLPLGLNTQEVTKRVLESQKQETIEALMAPNPQPQVDPKIQLEGQKLQFQAAVKGAELALKHLVEEAQANVNTTQAISNLADARLKTAQANVADHSANLNELEAHLNVYKTMQEQEEKEEVQEVNEQLGGAGGQ